jgi:hypothetical protein
MLENEGRKVGDYVATHVSTNDQHDSKYGAYPLTFKQAHTQNVVKGHKPNRTGGEIGEKIVNAEGNFVHGRVLLLK